MISFVRSLSVETLEEKNSTKESGRNLDIKALYNPEFDVDYDKETDFFNDHCEAFMKKFVEDMFMEDGFINQEDKAKFGLLVQHHKAREAFGKFIDMRRSVIQEVDEFTFYRLVQYFAITLFECDISDDFEPATSIMNMCFTYHFCSMMVPNFYGQSCKQYVYEYLKNQPIWKSERFWNAAFLHAIHADRKKRTSGRIKGWSEMSKEQRCDFELGEENSAFAHLASFLYMMKSFDVDKEHLDIFLHKMSVIGNLRNEQVNELEESIEFI